MKKMSRKEFLRWEKLRLKGKRFVVARTAIISGILFFVILNLASWAWSGAPLSRYLHVVYPVLGLITGTIIWWANEARFEAFLADKKANTRPRG